jgi:hypothetical protein
LTSALLRTATPWSRLGGRPFSFEVMQRDYPQAVPESGRGGRIGPQARLDGAKIM